jgi:hypothetical protein
VATQKQRRRRAKEKRHEYDLVEIDGEGNETVVRASEAKSSEPAKAKAKSADGKGQRQSSGRGTPQPPSWPRVFKRGLIFAPIFVAVVLLLGGGKVTLLGALVNALFLLAVFVPFSYWIDRFMWRSYQKRQAKAGAQQRR